MHYFVLIISKGLFPASLIAGLLGALSIMIVPVSIVSAGVVALVAMRRVLAEGLTTAFTPNLQNSW